MKTTVEISDPLLSEAKRVAERDGNTLRELIELGLRRVLDERNAAARKPYKLPDLRNWNMKLRPGIDLENRAQMLDLIYGFDELPDTEDEK